MVGFSVRISFFNIKICFRKTQGSRILKLADILRKKNFKEHQPVRIAMLLFLRKVYRASIFYVNKKC